MNCITLVAHVTELLEKLLGDKPCDLQDVLSVFPEGKEFEKFCFPCKSKLCAFLAHLEGYFSRSNLKTMFIFRTSAYFLICSLDLKPRQCCHQHFTVLQRETQVEQVYGHFSACI